MAQKGRKSGIQFKFFLTVTILALQLFLARNIPWSGPFPRCRVPVGTLRAIGGREGQVGRKHL